MKKVCVPLFSLCVLYLYYDYTVITDDKMHAKITVLSRPHIPFLCKS
ncbi:hypothetical protein QSI_3091 [Clostridioides difficile P28]|nr:hypothetical protein QSI_3091 [Clostridioides difficile P28]